jgi:hypothetical protein
MGFFIHKKEKSFDFDELQHVLNNLNDDYIITVEFNDFNKVISVNEQMTERIMNQQLEIENLVSEIEELTNIINSYEHKR